MHYITYRIFVLSKNDWMAFVTHKLNTQKIQMARKAINNITRNFFGIKMEKNILQNIQDKKDE